MLMVRLRLTQMWICWSSSLLKARRLVSPSKFSTRSTRSLPWISWCALRNKCSNAWHGMTFSCKRFSKKARSSMKPLTHEWIGKAEGDFATARREVRARKAPNYDAACFHAQQCVEKYLKALLQETASPCGCDNRKHAEEAKMAQVTFGLFDWIDRGKAPLQQLYEERLQLLEAADA